MPQASNPIVALIEGHVTWGRGAFNECWSQGKKAMSPMISEDLTHVICSSEEGEWRNTLTKMTVSDKGHSSRGDYLRCQNSLGDGANVTIRILVDEEQSSPFVVNVINVCYTASCLFVNLCWVIYFQEVQRTYNLILDGKLYSNGGSCFCTIVNEVIVALPNACCIPWRENGSGKSILT